MCKTVPARPYLPQCHDVWKGEFTLKADQEPPEAEVQVSRVVLFYGEKEQNFCCRGYHYCVQYMQSLGLGQDSNRHCLEHQSYTVMTPKPVKRAAYGC